MYLLGYDIGSSFVKASLLEAESGKPVATVSVPDSEQKIHSPKPGWAEQDPDMWWENVKAATIKLAQTTGIDLRQVKAIGISYQMHGLVLLDKQQRVLRPSIIWCDSRAVAIGEEAFQALGSERALTHLLNSPGNFTASKLKWVKNNEPDIYAQIYKAMLPGDFIATRLTGDIRTTPSGLSEGILWDYQSESPASLLLDYYGISRDLLPEYVPTFSVQGQVSAAVAQELGLATGTPIAYRAGDQPNNAFSLNVLQPGDVGATAGTSGVIYGITDQKAPEMKSRVNAFLHVNHTVAQPRYGILLCINGTGILNSWLKKMLMDGGSTTGDIYTQMNALAAQSPVGSEGLVTLPYGNGAERVLENRQLGASLHGLSFNTHGKAHYLRSAQEGIVFALNMGLDVMRGIGVQPEKIRAGDANMFLSPIFCEAFATITGATVELYNTDGGQGAARGAGIGAGIYANEREAFHGLKAIKTIEPTTSLTQAYQDAYQKWLSVLERELKA
ncbi:MAG: FGGY family carbohydrate kinase [Bacteroidota bacterium]